MSKIEAVTSNPGTTKENDRELTAVELDAVAGGTPKLLEAAAKGKVLSQVVIGWGGGTGPNLLGTVMAGAVGGGSGAVT